jgi:nucleoside diphosphate kinase
MKDITLKIFKIMQVKRNYISCCFQKIEQKGARISKRFGQKMKAAQM